MGRILQPLRVVKNEQENWRKTFGVLASIAESTITSEAVDRFSMVQFLNHSAVVYTIGKKSRRSYRCRYATQCSLYTANGLSRLLVQYQ